MELPPLLRPVKLYMNDYSFIERCCIRFCQIVGYSMIFGYKQIQKFKKK